MEIIPEIIVNLTAETQRRREIPSLFVEVYTLADQLCKNLQT